MPKFVTVEPPDMFGRFVVVESEFDASGLKLSTHRGQINPGYLDEGKWAAADLSEQDDLVQFAAAKWWTDERVGAWRKSLEDEAEQFAKDEADRAAAIVAEAAAEEQRLADEQARFDASVAAAVKRLNIKK